MNDTHPAMARRQIDLIRQMPDDRKAALASALRNRTYWLARRAIDEAHPELSEWERKLVFIRTHYGADLAERVRTRWRSQGLVDA